MSNNNPDYEKTIYFPQTWGKALIVVILEALWGLVLWTGVWFTFLIFYWIGLISTPTHWWGYNLYLYMVVWGLYNIHLDERARKRFIESQKHR